MKCPICGKQTLPGAKLCGPCRAALKRAKDDSVWELPSSQRPGESQAAPAASDEWVLGSPRRSGWRVWALGGGAVALCAIVGLQFARSGESVPVAVTQPAVAARPISDDPAPAALQRAVPTSMQGTAPSQSTANAAHDDPLTQPPRGADHPSRAPKTTRPSAEPVVAPAASPAVESPPAEPVRAAPPPPAAPARPVDPMQRLQDAIGRCGGENLFSRLGCEYRARTTYCEGHWGESPQCPAPTTNDHGQ